MKFKFSVLAFSLASLAFTNLAFVDLHAKNAKIFSKDLEKSSFFSASDTAAQTFNGSTTIPKFIPLTFTQNLHHRGHAIKSNGDQFRLKEGVYLVSFSGTFAVAGVPNAVNYDVALQLGSKFIFINTDSHEAPEGAATGITSVTKIIKVDDEHTDLSVVVRNTTPSSTATVTATTRSITIEKLK
jgi:hypothetical protein